ncbi:hypothetical protein G4177_10900 [Corallococcus sp. ZKHCc1 1396]|uniref:Uncharacterized protein n=1 Tax=Corallococcus soli TaxID=2710757 RepID=A0ABR9PLB5_9BACT|nr:hypothetical protein [Corallococcus soli]MBE4748671.1 hypothetical protein [Corallococcus soli]
MANGIYSSFFYADDKDLYDLLSPAHQKVSSPRLLEIARIRGIWLSSEDSREDLVRQVSLLSHDLHQLNQVLDLAESTERIEKSSTATITSASARQDILAAAEIVKAKCADVGEACEIRATGNNTVILKVRYPDFDPTKTRLRQRRDREVEIEIENRAGELCVRYTGNEKAKQILEELKDALPNNTPTPTSIREISLSGIKDPATRTQFFIDLFNSLDDWRLVDVSNVKIERIPPRERNEAASEETSDTRFSSAEKTMAGVVKRISLRGEGLIYSEEYRRLCDAGFFISRAVWQLDEKKPDGRRVEFEAGFNQPDEATDFRYTVRSLHERKKDGEFKSTRSILLDIDRKDLLRKLEASANTVFTKITSKSIGSSSSPSPPLEEPTPASTEGHPDVPKVPPAPATKARKTKPKTYRATPGED